MDHAATAAVAREEAAHGVAALLRAIQAGERPEESFRRLFELYHRPLLGFFARRGLPPADCQDLTQETFLGVHRGMGAFVPGAPFEPWLFTIAANALRKRRRYATAGVRQGAEVSLDEPETSAVLPADAASPLSDAVAGEGSRLLKAAIERLPPQMRSCLVLRVYRDLQYREIASVLQVSIETVKAHLFQARQRLRSELGPHFRADFDEEPR
jgi:RNA polymerase sigma-70 factor, ECF subfamily